MVNYKNIKVFKDLIMIKVINNFIKVRINFKKENCNQKIEKQDNFYHAIINY